MYQTTLELNDYFRHLAGNSLIIDHSKTWGWLLCTILMINVIVQYCMCNIESSYLKYVYCRRYLPRIDDCQGEAKQLSWCGSMFASLLGSCMQGIMNWMILHPSKMDWNLNQSFQRVGRPHTGTRLQKYISE